MKTGEKILIFVLIFCVYLRFISGFSLNNFLLPWGVDTPNHLFRVWYITKIGFTNWNYYLQGGEAFFGIYGPVLPFIGGMIGKITGFLLSYKIMNNLFFAITPIAFFYFLREFKISDENKIIALSFFTFMPIYSYFQTDGRWSSLINLFFGLVYWIFLKRSIDKNEKKYLILAGITLSISILTHITTTFFLILITSFWAIIYKFNFKTIQKLTIIGILSLLLISFWSFPLFLEIYSLRSTSQPATNNSSIPMVNPSNLQNWITERLLPSIQMYSTKNYSTFLLIAVTSVFCIFSLFKIKNKVTRDFFLTSIFILILIFLVNFKRSFIFLPITAGFLVAEGINVFKGKKIIILSALIFILLISSFFSIRVIEHQFPEYPKIPQDGRAIFLPFNEDFPKLYKYSIVLAPMNGNENIFAWGWEAPSYIMPYTAEKSNYNNNLSNEDPVNLTNPLKINQSDYYELLKAGWVNYVVVNKDYDEIVNYFNESNKFHLLNITENHVVFELNPKTSYVEINGKPVDVILNKNVDEISIKTYCEPGEMVIKESYNKNWKASINDNSIKLEQTKNSFIQTSIDENGECDIRLKFEFPNYYKIFDIVSIVSLIGVVSLLVYEFLIKKWLK